MKQSRDGWTRHLSVIRHPFIPNTSRESITSLRTHTQGTSIYQIRSSQKKNNSILPPQTLALFHIKLSPRDIISWILSLAESSARSGESPKQMRPSSMETGKYGVHYSHTQVSQTNFWANPTTIKDNPGVIICIICSKKPVWRNT